MQTANIWGGAHKPSKPGFPLLTIFKIPMHYRGCWNWPENLTSQLQPIPQFHIGAFHTERRREMAEHSGISRQCERGSSCVLDSKYLYGGRTCDKFDRNQKAGATFD